MQRKESAIEVKVGALVILAIVLLGVFVFFMGDFQFGKRFYLFVDFDNAGGLKPGADVRVAGIPAGQVEQIRFLGGEYDETLQRHVYVRVRLEIQQEMHGAVGEGAAFIITTLSVLGEPYIEIVNTVPPGPPIAENSIQLGQSPVRLDEMLRSAYRGLRGLDNLLVTVDRFFQESDLDRLLTETADLAEHLDLVVQDNADQVEVIIAGVEETVTSIRTLVTDNQPRIDNIVQTLESAMVELDQLGMGLNEAVGDGRVIRSATERLEEVLNSLSQQAPGILADVGSSAQRLDRILEEGEEPLVQTLTNASGLSAELATASGELAALAAYVNAGRGSIGALLRDDELYDDIRELIRELKRRPWRLVWKE
ncbi:MAG: MCE family protein [Bradymonadales bacterium]|nr:MCE family protein [Bradymonadales bacterium]